MKKVFAAGLALALFVAASAAMSARPVPVGDVTVTVTYTGKGPVDDTHEILVFLFDHAMPTAGSEPIALQVTTKSGGTVTFKDVATDPVYVTAVYDEQAAYDGRTGPPPAGEPIGAYQKDGKALPVKPGDKIKMSFDDSVRWK